MGQGAYAFFSWSKEIWLVATTVFLADGFVVGHHAPKSSWVPISNIDGDELTESYASCPRTQRFEPVRDCKIRDPQARS